MKPRIPQLHGPPQLITTTSGTDHPLAKTPTEVADGQTLGFHCPVWTTRDDRLILRSSGRQRSGLRRRPIRELDATEIEDGFALDAVLSDLATGQKLALHLTTNDKATTEAVSFWAFESKTDHAIHLVVSDLGLISNLSNESSLAAFQTVRLRDLDDGPERHFAALRNAGAAGLEMYFSDWNAGLVTLAHRFELSVSAYGAEQERELANLIDMGVDVIQTTRIEQLIQIASQFTFSKAPRG